MSPTTEPPRSSKTWHGPSPPAELTENASSLQLLSQGAEARVWLVTLPSSVKDDGDTSDGGGRKRTVNVGSGITVPQLLSLSQQPSPLLPNGETSVSDPLTAICKERFPKKYRHPQLDISLTKSRTKGEARSLIRCQRAGVPSPNVLAIANWPNKTIDGAVGGGNENGGGRATTSSCLFMECVEGCTVRQYFEQRSEKGVAGEAREPAAKRPRCEENTTESPKKEERVTTVIDSQTLCVARTIGTLVAKMHAAGVIHGDLTTSNIMLRNPPQSDEGSSNMDTSWTPQLILIDFGLAASTASTGNKANSAASGKKSKPYKQQHNAEEKAVDLYVLERAFLSTHPESELLVEEVWKGYRGYFEELDCDTIDGVAEDAEKEDAAVNSCSSRGGDESIHGHVAKAVMTRLEQVRMRGRKRECFG